MAPPAKRQIPKPHPWEAEQAAEPVSFGTWLRRQREMRELGLREIADHTKISLRYLEALEQDRFDVLPAPVFAKGFLREYARYVGLNPDEVVNSYLTAQCGADGEEDDAVEERRERRSRLEWTSGVFLILAVLVLMALVAFLAFYAERKRGRQTDRPPIAAPAPAVVPVAPVPEPAVEPAPAPIRVTLDFTADCWVESTVDGERRISELRVQGESLRIEAAERVLLTLGNAGGVRVEVNGKPFDLGFTPGQVARDVEIDLDTVAALEGSMAGERVEEDAAVPPPASGGPTAEGPARGAAPSPAEPEAG